MICNLLFLFHVEQNDGYRVITGGSYDEVKRCAFRTLDFARVADLVQALLDWAMLMELELSGLCEELRRYSVLLSFDYDLTLERSADTVGDLFMMIAEKTDCELYRLELEGKLLYKMPKGWSSPPRISSGRRGKVAFLLDVPDGFEGIVNAKAAKNPR